MLLGKIGLISAGLVPSVLGSGAAWGTYLYAYGLARSRKAKQGVELSALQNLLSATEAGLLVSVVTNPIWVVKTRLQLQEQSIAGKASRGAKRMYKGTLDCFRTIVRDEGVSGLYKGLLPSLILVSHGAIQLALYEKLKAMSQEMTRLHGWDQQVSVDGSGDRISAQNAGLCGALSKAGATLVTYPTQVVRARLQQRMDSRALKYSSFTHVVRVTMRREGVSGFYKGLVPNLLRVMPQSAVTFLVYEAVLNALHHQSQLRATAPPEGISSSVGSKKRDG